MSESENPMVVGAFWEYDLDGRKTGRNPYLAHSCDECGNYMHEDDDVYDYKNDDGQSGLICAKCYVKLAEEEEAEDDEE